LNFLFFFKFFLSLSKLFLLFLSNLNGLRTNQHLVLHLLKSRNEFLLLGLGFFFSIFSLSNFFQKFIFLFLLHISLILNFSFFLLSFKLNFLLLSFKLFFEFSHLFFIFNLNDLGDDVLVTNDSFLSHEFRWITTGGEERQLFSKFCDFILIFSQESIFWVLVNSWLVFNVLGSRSVSEGVHGFIVVVIGWTDVGDHQCFGVTTKRILEKTSKLGVSVRNISSLWICKS